ncbi:MAG: CBS domain-containing protein [Spirochaetia bacterium]|jgi:CBS domain-containing protein
MDTVGEFLSKKGSTVWSVDPGATVFQALKLMAEKNIGAVVVMDAEKRIHGIFSERDYARKMMGEGMNAQATKVGEIMTTLLVTVNPDTRINECMALMTEKRVRHLPVIDGEKLVGVVSIGDVVKSVVTEQEMVISQQAYKIDQLENYISLTP